MGIVIFYRQYLSNFCCVDTIVHSAIEQVSWNKSTLSEGTKVKQTNITTFYRDN